MLVIYKIYIVFALFLFFFSRGVGSREAGEDGGQLKKG